MASNDGRPDPAAVRSSGLLWAYMVVVGLILACAAWAYTGLERQRVPSTDATAGLLLPLPTDDIGTIALPPVTELRVNFRKLSPSDRSALVEVTADGERLPTISSSGWMPWIANARRFDQSGLLPRIGLLMVNLGADDALMSRAIDELPPEVSLAFLAGTADLPNWLAKAHERGHECYLMLPVEDPNGPAERGIRPIEGTAEPAENLRRLRSAMARGMGCVGFVVPGPSVVSQSDLLARPLVKEIADRGLALIEINPNGVSALYRLTVELGVAYARSASVLDYKSAGQAGIDRGLERLVQWTAERPDDTPRHDFGVLQPGGAAIDAIVAWRERLTRQDAVGLVPIVGHMECRDACMARLRRQPEQLKP